MTDAGGNPKASFIYDLHSGKLVDSWNPDDLVVINLEQGFNGTLSYRFPRNVDLRIPPKRERYKPNWPKWLEDLNNAIAIFNEDGTRIFRPYISAYWIPSWNHWEDASYWEPDPLGPITFIRYNPNEMGLHGGQGRSNEKSWENYRNCVINCFSGENGPRSGRNITNKPSERAEKRWNDWRQNFNNIMGFVESMAGITLSVLLVIIVYIAQGTLTTVCGLGVFLTFASIGASIMLYEYFQKGLKHYGNFTLSGFFENFSKERECRSYCNKYSPA